LFNEWVVGQKPKDEKSCSYSIDFVQTNSCVKQYSKEYLKQCGVQTTADILEISADFYELSEIIKTELIDKGATKKD
jgi:hypothetical protein